MKNQLLFLIAITFFFGCKKENNVPPDYPLIGTWTIQSEITSYYNGKSKLIGKDTLPSEFLEFKEITLTEKAFKWLGVEEDYDGSSRYSLSTDSLEKNYLAFSDRKYQYIIKANILKLISVVPGRFKPDEEPYYGIREITYTRKE